MLIRDVDGAMFDSGQVEATTERFEDAQKGQLARVRLRDGTSRLVSISELELARRDDAAGASFFEAWPMPSGHG